jgi:phospholipase/lecithinase/hemolysin
MPKQLRPFHTLAACCAAGLLTFLAEPVHARLSSLDHLFVFGDSLTDTGNSWALTGNFFPPSPFYDQGRASNGPVSSEYLWELFNPGSTGPTPSLNGGTNYAINGSTTGLINFNSIRAGNPEPIKVAFTDKGAAYQLNAFNTANPSFNPNSSLFLIWLFPNDVLSWLSTNSFDSGTVLGGSPQQTNPAGLIGNGITNIATIINVLALEGATHFLVPNMPDLASTPLFRSATPEARLLLTALTDAFNTNLDPVLQSLDATLPGVEITRFQTDDLFAKVIENPSSYGFTNVTDACMTISPYTTCSNPSEWLFWDDFHPTTAGQQLVAQNFYTSVVPGPLPVAGVTVAFGWSRRLRRRIKQGRLVPQHRRTERGDSSNAAAG